MWSTYNIALYLLQYLASYYPLPLYPSSFYHSSSFTHPPLPSSSPLTLSPSSFSLSHSPFLSHISCLPTCLSPSLPSFFSPVFPPSLPPLSYPTLSGKMVLFTSPEDMIIGQSAALHRREGTSQAAASHLKTVPNLVSSSLAYHPEKVLASRQWWTHPHLKSTVIVLA